MQLKHNFQMPNLTTFMVQIGENHYSNPKLKFHKLLTKCWRLCGVFLFLCSTNGTYHFQRIQLLSFPFNCFAPSLIWNPHFSPSTQNSYFFRVWRTWVANRCLQLSLAVAFIGFSDLWVLERECFLFRLRICLFCFFFGPVSLFFFFWTCWIFNSGLGSPPTQLWNLISILPSPWIDLMAINWTPYNLPLIT